MAPVVEALANTPGIESKVCVTAQHRQMLDQVLNIFGIQPDIDLNVMRPNQSLSELSAEIMLRLAPVLREVKPDWLLVQGDTTTVMVTALLGYYHQIRVGHVEAGLRTGDKWQPYPEEINRRIAGVVADLHFAPTEHSRRNLLAEGVPGWRIVLTGNPVIDALNKISAAPAPPEALKWLEDLKIGQNGRKLAMITAHRRENFGRPLEDICLALRRLAEKYQGSLQLVYPVHLNPNVQEPVYRLLGQVPNITLLPPLDYLPMVHLNKQAAIILTDSGGIQEEATGLGVPTLVLRERTERPEGVEAGALKLVGTDPERILQAACQILDNPKPFKITTNPFGDGQAAQHIVQALLNYREQEPAA